MIFWNVLVLYIYVEMFILKFFWNVDVDIILMYE